MNYIITLIKIANSFKKNSDDFEISKNMTLKKSWNFLLSMWKQEKIINYRNNAFWLSTEKQLENFIHIILNIFNYHQNTFLSK